MKKIGLSIVALALVPCLIAEPLTASGFQAAMAADPCLRTVSRVQASASMNKEALAAAAMAFFSVNAFATTAPKGFSRIVAMKTLSDPSLSHSPVLQSLGFIGFAGIFLIAFWSMKNGSPLLVGWRTRRASNVPPARKPESVDLPVRKTTAIESSSGRNLPDLGGSTKPRPVIVPEAPQPELPQLPLTSPIPEDNTYFQILRSSLIKGKLVFGQQLPNREILKDIKLGTDHELSLDYVLERGLAFRKPTTPGELNYIGGRIATLMASAKWDPISSIKPWTSYYLSPGLVIVKTSGSSIQIIDLRKNHDDAKEYIEDFGPYVERLGLNPKDVLKLFGVEVPDQPAAVIVSQPVPVTVSAVEQKEKPSDLRARRYVESHEKALTDQLKKALTYKHGKRNLPVQRYGLFASDRETFISDLIPLLDASQFAYAKKATTGKKDTQTIHDVLAIRDALQAAGSLEHNANFVHRQTGLSVRRIRSLWDIAVFKDKYPTITHPSGSRTINLNSYGVHPEAFRSVVRELLIVKEDEIRALLAAQTAPVENRATVAIPQRPRVRAYPPRIPPKAERMPTFPDSLIPLLQHPSTLSSPQVWQQLLLILAFLQGTLHYSMTQISSPPVDPVEGISQPRHIRELDSAA